MQGTGRVVQIYVCPRAASVEGGHLIIRLDLYPRTNGHISSVRDTDAVETVTAKQDIVRQLPAIECKVSVRTYTPEQILQRMTEEEFSDDQWLLICSDLDLVKDGFKMGALLPLTEASSRGACQDSKQEPSDLLGQTLWCAFFPDSKVFEL